MATQKILAYVGFDVKFFIYNVYNISCGIFKDTSDSKKYSLPAKNLRSQ